MKEKEEDADAFAHFVALAANADKLLAETAQVIMAGLLEGMTRIVNLISDLLLPWKDWVGKEEQEQIKNKNKNKT